MENGAVASSETLGEKMVASNTNNTARRVVLQERRRQIEEALSKCNLELRQLCIQEAELTGVTPPEMPLEEGETPPTIRRKVGTTYQLSEYLLNNSNKDQLISDLELQIQVHMNLAEAALGIANDGVNSKTVKRVHRAEYQKYKTRVNALQQQLLDVKEKASEQIKQKKKQPRNIEQEDNISVMTHESPTKPDHRHSQISTSKQSLTMLSPADTYPEARYPPGPSRQPNNRHSDNVYMLYPKPEEPVTSGIYRMSLDGYNHYIEKLDTVGRYHPSQGHSFNYPHSSLSQPMLAGQHYPQQHSPILLQGSPQILQQSPILLSSQHLTQLQRPQVNPSISPNMPQQAQPQHSPLMLRQPQLGPLYHFSHSPHPPQHLQIQQPRSPLLPQQTMLQNSPTMQISPQMPSHSPISQQNISMQRASQNYSRVSQQYAQFYRQPSPTASTSVGSLAYPSHTLHGEPGYNRYTVDGGSSYRHTTDTNSYRNTIDASGFRNPLPIQPHQQYEQNGMNTGLGGCWKRSETGELLWMTTVADGSWEQDKRFGSLDRRRNRRMQKRMSPAENKSATLAIMPAHNEVKTAFVKPSQVPNKRGQDHRQLIRTQSLGSVGQAVDSVYPSDDTSSCESDNRSLKENRAVRKQKEKEWLETSLDGPISPTHSVVSRSQSTIPPTLSPEEQYVAHPPPTPSQLSGLIPGHINPAQLNIAQFNMPPPRPNNFPITIQSPISPKPVLEIPAESNPSPRVPESPYMELLNNNNNIPKHCTVVQAGACKPYHEETKPFEMSDFYKYSTKYKKSPQKETSRVPSFNRAPGGPITPRNLTDNFEGNGDRSKPFSPGRPMEEQHYHPQHSSTGKSANTSSNFNTSFDHSQITVADRFSEEMNAWYEDQDHNENNNNSGDSKKGQSNATLV